MDDATTIEEIIESFEGSFADRKIIPKELKVLWLKKAIGRYSTELKELEFDEEYLEFNEKLKRYTIDTLANFMTELYQKRQVSKVNKTARIVGKDISIDGGDGLKKYNESELHEIKYDSKEMIHNQKKTVYV